MKDINLNNRKFLLIENSKNGAVNSETVFEYKQDGDLVTADYSGGTIRYGKIIGYLSNNQLIMRYQCLTTENELKSGKAIADISLTKKSKIKLSLNWQWLDEENKKGTSEYIEY